MDLAAQTDPTCLESFGLMYPLDLRREKPVSYSALKQAVYDGVVFILPPSPESLRLVHFAKSELARTLTGAGNLQRIHERLAGKELYQAMSGIRKSLSDPQVSRSYISEITKPFGLLAPQTVFDVLRLRCNPHQIIRDETAPYQFVHRDTWYGNPQCQINWWIPLFDTTEEQGFTFFPDCFNQAIPNTSSDFDYDRWSDSVGFHTDKTVESKYYPTSMNAPVNKGFTFSCKAGGLVIFSAAHLHRTAHNKSGLSRFSIDYRTVDLEDKARRLGAPNRDNDSQGDASSDYFNLAGRDFT